jgi:hypothetical protein
VIVMARGGARNRSGPAPVPGSGRSERRGLVFVRLPGEGRRGRTPRFPLSERRVYRWASEGKARFQVFDADATALVAERERELWRWAWRTPQAVAWELEPWRWPIVAMWVRTFVVCESDDATAADKGSLHRFADQIGLTPAGLRENGWVIAADEVAERRKSPTVEAEADGEGKVFPRRLSVVAGAQQ